MDDMFLNTTMILKTEYSSLKRKFIRGNQGLKRIEET